MNQKTKAIFSVLLIIILFGLVSYFTQQNIGTIKDSIGEGPLGIIIYIFITCLATVVAPLSTVPLIPLASGMYGWFLAGIYNIIGWFLGALIIFWICRSYGVKIIGKLFPMGKIHGFESHVPEENIFFSIVLLRMITPVDILSYILGLFSEVDFRTYSIATLIGIAPFAFIFSYLGMIPFYYQAVGLLIVILVVFLLTGFYKRLRKKKKKQ